MSEPSDKADSATLTGKERRTSQRHDFPYIQKIAPMVDGELPPPESFFPVRCKDLSAGGVSLVVDSEPDFDQLVIILGAEPALHEVAAQVIHVAPLEEDGIMRYMLGCQFTERVQR